METMIIHDYSNLLNNLKEKIRQSRVKTTSIINVELLTIYHDIGRLINQQEKEKGWGKKVVEKLSKDLQSEFKDMKGLSPRNLRYMRDFASPTCKIIMVSSYYVD